jgi:HK97 family phage prohead protease
MNEIYTRVSKAGTKSGERKMTFVASDATKDSYGTVLMPSGWDLDRFNKNPVIGYQHALQYSGDPDNVVGKGRAYIEDDKLMVDVEFEPAGMNEKADKVWKKLEFGTLNAVSVGFVPREGRWGVGDEAPGKANETYYYTRMELLEISVVAIPANPNALKNEADPETDRLSVLRKAALEAEEDRNKAKDLGHDPAPSNSYDRDIAIAEAELLLLETEN